VNKADACMYVVKAARQDDIGVPSSIPSESRLAGRRASSP
jgi:hypothetical protein